MVNLFHGVAVYSGVVIVCKLAGLVGLLLYVLTGMALLAPIVFSITVLLTPAAVSASHMIAHILEAPRNILIGA